jgi:hypothetical protein
MNEQEIVDEVEKIMNAFITDYIGDDEGSEYRRNCFDSFFSDIMQLWETKGYAALTTIINASTPD